MLSKIQPWWVLFALLVFNLVGALLVHGEPQVPCFFIFGDSLVDNGNNNDLSTHAKANYPPYGIDYPDGPTGRFTNGLTTVDFLAEHLGFNHHIPSYESTKKDTNDSVILEGVNYASGSAGIREETGSHLGLCDGLAIQVNNHKTIFSRLVNNIFKNKDQAQEHLNKCLYYLGIGSNDFLNNFYVPEHYPGSQKYSLEEYTDSLIELYELQIRSLYQYYGARKFALVGAGDIGCTPRAAAMHMDRGATGCVEKLNIAVEGFNNKLLALVDKLNSELTKAKFIYISSSGAGMGNPMALGFKNLESGCCTVREDGQCGANKPPCPIRTEYLFWDSFHPTEGIHRLNAGRMYKAFGPNDSHPFDISHLVAENLI